MSKIRIGIVGYGNLGRGVEASVKLQPDMELVGVFSRRKGLETVSGVPTYTMEDLPQTLSNKLQWSQNTSTVSIPSIHMHVFLSILLM